MVLDRLVRGVLTDVERADLQQPGAAGAAEAVLGHVEARLAAELLACDGVMFLPPLTAAWARVQGLPDRAERRLASSPVAAGGPSICGTRRATREHRDDGTGRQHGGRRRA